MVLHSATEILKAIASVEDPKIVITTHHKPDADAMGSSLGLKLFLESIGYNATVISPTDYASFLKWMKSDEQTIVYEHNPTHAKALTDEADFIFCLDFKTSTTTCNWLFAIVFSPLTACNFIW